MRSFVLTVLLALLFVVLFLGPLFLANAFGSCHSSACWHRVHEHRAQHWCLAHERCVWKHRFEAEPLQWQRWAKATGSCESGNNPGTNTGNGYFGAMQFDLRTAHEAYFRRRPDFTTLFEQYVRAIELARRVGTHRWPVCG